MAFFHAIVLLALTAQAFSLPASAAVGSFKSTGLKGGFASQAAAAAPAEEAEEKFPPRDYQFNYNINDGIAGMAHSRAELQKNGVVSGEYKYTRPDGVLQSVRYTADEEGFHSEIREEAAPAFGNSGKATYAMDLPDSPETIKISVTEEELKATHSAGAEKSYGAEAYPAQAYPAKEYAPEEYPVKEYPAAEPAQSYGYEAPTTTSTTTTTTTTTQKPYVAAAPAKPAYY